jgi:hypothetical protein
VAELRQKITEVPYAGDKQTYLSQLHELVIASGYHIVEEFSHKPWDGMFRMSSDDAGRFIEEFFPGLTLREASLGKEGMELSPKFLIVLHEHRLSWQYHHRRAERWCYLAPGAYRRSATDEECDREEVTAGQVCSLNRVKGTDLRV